MRGLRLGILIGAFGACGFPVAVASAQNPNPVAAYTTNGAYSFVSAPNLHPPRLHTDRPTVRGKLALGDFFVANFKDLTKKGPMVGQTGPLILDSHLQPLWFDPICTSTCSSQDLFALNLHVQTYNGKPALSWWQGGLNPIGNPVSGEDVVVDQHYRHVASLTGQQGWTLSEHEFLISGGHFAWVTAYKIVPMDLTAYGGSANGQLLDSAAQEYDLRTGKLLRTWDAVDHIPLSQSQTKPTPPASPMQAPWDAYHINSIDLTGNGTMLVSMRNTWAAYLVNIGTGNVQWTLSDNPKVASTFRVASNAGFQWQHDVRLHPGGLVSIFDNACCAIAGVKNGMAQFAPQNGTTRGLVLKLNMANHAATFVAQYTRSRTEAAFVGNAQLLPNGNVVVGWGSKGFFTEYSKTGRLLLDAVWPGPNLSYRAFVQRWVGKPFFPPSGAARKKRGRTTVYASWDGATQVAAWRVVAGPNVRHLRTVAFKGKTGFETAIRLNAGYRVFRVKALDSRGHVIGTSKAFTVPKPNLPPPSPGFY